jgi:anti-sigma-K factor RskA
MSEEDELESPVFDALALGVEPVAPPARLRARILAAAAQPSDDARVVELRPPGRPGGLRVPLGAVAAALVVALLGGLVIGRVTAPPPPPAVTHFTLAGHGPMQGSTATVTDLKQDGIALVSFSGLPPAPEGKVYELWLITPGNRADPAGIFLPDANGQRLLVVEKPLAGYKVMAVTVEAGPSGVASPTQVPDLLGTVA